MAEITSQMDPLAHYCAKADHERRVYNAKINSEVGVIVGQLPIWYAVPDIENLTGTADSANNEYTDDDWREVWRRIDDDRFEEFHLSATIDNKLVVTWSWCPIEYRVLILAQLLPIELVKIIYDYADTTNQKVGRIIDKYFHPLYRHEWPDMITDTGVVVRGYFTETKFMKGRFNVTKRVRAELLKLVDG